MYEKYINNSCNFWRSIRLKQNWGEKDIINPEVIFGCNNILNTTNLDLQKIYNNKNYFVPETYGGINEIESSKILKKFFKKISILIFI